MSANKDALLLRINKEDQIKALHELGFMEVSMDTPLSEFPGYIRWAAGLRDLRVACVKIEDSSIVCFSEDDWNNMSANAKSFYSKVGISIRARKREFIISPTDCVDSSGKYTFTFGGRGRDFIDVKNYAAGAVGLLDVDTGYSDTQKIIEQTDGIKDSSSIIGAPAALAAWSYKANEYDPLQWYLPSIAELRIIVEFLDEINAFLTTYFGGVGKIPTSSDTWYWSSTEYDTQSSWYCYTNNGSIYYLGRNSSLRVRPVAVAK